MQQTGTLRKRSRRQLSKVNGLSTLEYDKKEDTFTGDIYSEEISKKSIYTRGEFPHTRINMSSAEFAASRKNIGRSSESTRVTRDPIFHERLVDEQDLEKSLEHNINEQTEQDDKFKPDIHNRTHFLDSHVISRLKQLIWLGKTSGSFPWKWNENQNQIEKWGPIKEKIWFVVWSLLLFQTTCLCANNFHTMWKVASAGNTTNRELFMLWFNLQINLIAIDYNINIYFHGDKIRHYVNTLLKFNYDMVKKYVIHLDGYKDGSRFQILYSSLFSLAQVPISVACFLMTPFAPIYLFSHIYPKPWYWLIPGAIQQYCVCGQLITLQVLTTWLVVVHTSSMQFWLRETHNHNNSDWTSEALRTPETSLKTFKSLQVLNSVFNECMAPLLMPMTFVHFFLLLLPSSFVLIRSLNYLFIQGLPYILTYPLAIFDVCIDALAILNMSAQVLDLGCGFIDSWSRTKSMHFRRVLMSCAPPRIRVARFFFLSISTTVSFFQIVWEYVTNAILTFK